MNCKYCINKLDKMVKQEIYLNVDYMNNVKIKNSNKYVLRDIELSQKHLDIIAKVNELSNSKNVIAIQFAELFGLRVSEICKLKGKDMNIENKILRIVDSKGSRSRDIKILITEQLNLCNNIKCLIAEEERVCPLREDSVNTFLRRTLLKI